jgi:hypothetical protein
LDADMSVVTEVDGVQDNGGVNWDGWTRCLVDHLTQRL